MQNTELNVEIKIRKLLITIQFLWIMKTIEIRLGKNKLKIGEHKK